MNWTANKLTAGIKGTSEQSIVNGKRPGEMVLWTLEKDDNSWVNDGVKRMAARSW